MTAKSTRTRIVEWLRDHQPGSYSVKEIAIGLGHENGSAEHRNIGRTLTRMDEDQEVTTTWITGGQRSYAYRRELKAPAPRVQPSVLHRRKSAQALGLIPAPVGRDRSTEMAPSAPARFETVAEFRARGGKVEHVQGFEAVRPHLVRPAWKVAA